MERFVLARNYISTHAKTIKLQGRRWNCLMGGKGEIPLQVPKLLSLCHHPTQKDSHRRYKVGQGV